MNQTRHTSKAERDKCKPNILQWAGRVKAATADNDKQRQFDGVATAMTLGMFIRPESAITYLLAAVELLANKPDTKAYDAEAKEPECPPEAVMIEAVLDDTNPAIRFAAFGGPAVAITPDSATEIGLKLLQEAARIQKSADVYNLARRKGHSHEHALLLFNADNTSEDD